MTHITATPIQCGYCMTGTNELLAHAKIATISSKKALATYQMVRDAHTNAIEACVEKYADVLYDMLCATESLLRSAQEQLDKATQEETTAWAAFLAAL